MTPAIKFPKIYLSIKSLFLFKKSPFELIQKLVNLHLITKTQKTNQVKSLSTYFYVLINIFTMIVHF